ncbi:Alcohol dehydrogenase GroES domain protein [Aphelenchoides fujianensis]|nr:Alcohol dehydrogenase GroES domain protein [Aphelenchoides fujianensis]
MDAMMKAAVVRAFGQPLVIEDRPRPKPGRGQTLCEKQQNTGYSVDGGFAEYVLADADYVGLIPENLSSVEAAPILCAGVTVYKGLKVLDAKPGDWVAISGVGGLGHLAVQYAKAMGFKVAAIDVAEDKLALARELGAELTVDASREDPVAVLQGKIGGAQGVLVTAVSRAAFGQAIGMVRRGGTVSLNGLPPGDFPLSIFDTVLRGITVRGSIVGTRLDLMEALAFAADGRVKATVSTEGLGAINDIFQRMEKGGIEGRVSPLPDAPPFARLHERYRAGGLDALLDEGMLAPADPPEEGSPRSHPRMPMAKFDDDQRADLKAYLKSLERTKR